MGDPAGTGYDLFIVHAPDDLGWAKRLQARLSEDGVRAALENHLPGDLIIGRFEELIKTSVTCVFVYSRASEADEFMAAKYQALLARPNAYRFIPVLLDDVPIGPFAAARMPIDFRGEEQEGSYRVLLQAVRNEPRKERPLEPYRNLQVEGAIDRVLRIGLDAVAYGPPGRHAQAAHMPKPLTHALEQRLWHLDHVRAGRGGSLTPKSQVTSAGRGQLVEACLRDVGTALGDIFLSGPAGEALVADLARAAEGNRTLRLALRVDDDALAVLPWETLIPPGLARPLALHPNAEPFREISAAGLAPVIPVNAPLRILAVVASPEGPGSGPLLDMEDELARILDGVEEARRHAAAHVRILNEGTLGAITDALKQERFHILHISCHAAPGVLHLEDETGGRDEVTAERLARAIPRDRGVPLVVLSGCSTALDVRTARDHHDGGEDDASKEESPQGEDGGEAALTGLARGLSANGVPAVLAMTAPVSDRYASLLTGALYRELALRPRPDVLTALSQARRDLEAWRAAQPAQSRDAMLAEWATPALFLRTPALPLYDIDRGVDRIQPAHHIALAPGVTARPIGHFVGRRTDLRRLRTALLDGRRPGALLHGIGGVGKSSLAAEPLPRLGHRAGLVVSQVGQTSPDQILAAIADALLAATVSTGEAGDPIRRLSRFLRRFDEPWHVRLNALTTQLARLSAEAGARLKIPPITLLLDNFEDNLAHTTGFSITDQELAEFIRAWLEAGDTVKLLVTSRFPFELPRRAHGRLAVCHVGPLSKAEARKLMWRLPGLDALSAADRERAWLDVGGHPRTLEYLDALLRKGRARFPDVRERLEDMLERRGIPDPAGWLTRTADGLDAALAEAVTLAADDALLSDLLSSLGEFERRLLIGASVYRRPVDRAGLYWPVGIPAITEQEYLDREERLNAVSELLKRAREQDPEARLEDLELSDAELQQVQADLVALRAPWVAEPAGLDQAVGVLTGLGLLTPAESPGAGETSGLEGAMAPVFPSVSGHGGMMVHWWTAGSLASLTDADGLAAAHRAAVEYWHWRIRTWPQDAWQDVRDMLEARHHAHAAGDLRVALQTTDWVCERLHTWGAWAWEERLYRETATWVDEGSREQAACHHQLGLIAESRGEYAQAEQWYRRSLSAKEELGDRPGIAADHHQLGFIAESRGEYGQAEESYRRALTINEELGHRSGIAAGNHQLGRIAQIRGEYAQAEERYRRALAIREELGDQLGIATGHHQLGRIAEERGEYGQAEQRYRRALAIREEQGDQIGIAACHHQLGIIAQGRGEYGQAEERYRRALTIREELGDQIGIAASYHQLGVIASARMEYGQAEEWCRRALAVNEELGDRSGVATGYHQLGVIAELRKDYEQAEQWYLRALAIREESGDRTRIASGYHQLGRIAQAREEYGQAEEWCRRALAVNEELGNQAGIADTTGQMGVLLTKTGRAAEAVAYTSRSLRVYTELQSPKVVIDLHCLASQRRILGDEEFRRLLAEQFDAEEADAFIIWLDRQALMR